MNANAWLDTLPRATFGRYTQPVPAFRTCGIIGFYGAVLTLMAAGLVTGRSLLVLAGVATVAGLSFFSWAFLRRAVTGHESLVLLEHVWFAETCVALWLWVVGAPVLPNLDVLAVGLCIFLAAGRVGCLLVGCCHGRPSSVGIRYGPELARDGLAEHVVGVRLLPVQAFEAIALVAVGAVGFAALAETPPGAVFTWFLIAYAVIRFGLEGLRGDDRPHLLGLSVNRWMCIAEFALGLWLSIGHDLPTTDELATAGLLMFVLAASILAANVRRSRRRALLGTAHLEELRSLVASAAARAAETETAVIAKSSKGVSIGTSLEFDIDRPELHVSLSGPGSPDFELLCELAAQTTPTPDGRPRLGPGGLLHLRVPSPAGTVVGGQSGREIYAAAVRAAQEPDDHAEIDVRVPQLRDAYFDRSAVPRVAGN